MKNSDVMEWLLEKENPSVRYFMLTTLLGKPMLDPEVIEARKAIMEYGAVPKILSKQKEGGYWSEPDKFYRRLADAFEVDYSACIESARGARIPKIVQLISGIF